MSFGHWTHPTLQFTPSHNQLRAQMKGVRQWQLGRERKKCIERQHKGRKKSPSKHWQWIIRRQDLVMPCDYSILWYPWEAPASQVYNLKLSLKKDTWRGREGRQTDAVRGGLWVHHVISKSRPQEDLGRCSLSQSDTRSYLQLYCYRKLSSCDITKNVCSTFEK